MDNQAIPLQRLTRAEKVANNYQWYKDSIDYYIRNASIPRYDTIKENKTELSRTDEIKMLIDLHNNVIPKAWFALHTNPVNGKGNFFPAQIRGLNILRPNIDFLFSTYTKRELQHTVSNTEPSAYDDFVQKKLAYQQQVIQQRFIQVMQNGEQSDGTPEQLMDNFGLSYTDAIAAKAQDYLSEVFTKHDLKEKSEELFLQYCIHGEPRSYRAIENGKLLYEIVDPINFFCGSTSQSNYVEDAPWCIYRRQLSINEFADKFHGKITEEDWKDIDKNAIFSVTSLANYASSIGNGSVGDRKIEVFHVCWNSLKKEGTLYKADEYGQVTPIVVDEDYEEQPGDYLEWNWVSQIYHGYKAGIGDKALFISMGEYPYAVSSANGLPSNKLPYNGINFSYKTDKVFSPLKMGVPYLIMFLICNFQIEKLLAKNKGKVLILDFNVIPKKNGWNEEKFIKYIEANGYAFIDREQLGVDKSFNQYQAIDMSTLGDVNNLIQLTEYYKAQWDDLIGIPKPMRGQNLASSQVGTVQSSIVQSSIGIEHIFQKYARFSKRDLQYILELCKYLTLDGHRSLIDKDDYGKVLLEIFPGEMLVNLGVKVVDAGVEEEDLRQLKQYATQVNQQDPEAIVSILTAHNIPQLKRTLSSINKRAQKNQQAQAQSEHDNAMELQSMKQDEMKLQNLLDSQLLSLEYDRKDEIEYIKGDVAISTVNGTNTLAPVNPDSATNIDEIINKSRDRLSKEKLAQQQLAFKEKELTVKYKMNQENNATALKNKTSSGK